MRVCVCVCIVICVCLLAGLSICCVTPSLTPTAALRSEESSGWQNAGVQLQLHTGRGERHPTHCAQLMEEAGSALQCALALVACFSSAKVYLISLACLLTLSFKSVICDMCSNSQEAGYFIRILNLLCTEWFLFNVREKNSHCLT